MYLAVKVSNSKNRSNSKLSYPTKYINENCKYKIILMYAKYIYVGNIVV